MRAILASSLRGSDESRTVTLLELFFDLVFVFVVSQLTHLLVAYFDGRGAIEALILTLAVVYAWYMTAWYELDVAGHLPVQALLLTIMLLSLPTSSGIDGAFTGNAWLFVIPYVVIQVGRAAFATVMFMPGSNRHIHFVTSRRGSSRSPSCGSPAHSPTATPESRFRRSRCSRSTSAWPCSTRSGPAEQSPRAPIGPDARGVHSDVAGETSSSACALFLMALARRSSRTARRPRRRT